MSSLNERLKSFLHPLQFRQHLCQFSWAGMTTKSRPRQVLVTQLVHTNVACLGLSHLGPGWGVGPSDCVEEVGGGGGVVGGGEVSIG